MDLNSDTCTIVSVMPFELNKDIPHVSPGNYRIPEVKSPFTEYNILHVSRATCYWYVGNNSGENQDGWVNKIIPSDDMAAAIVRDEIGSTILTQVGVVQPGIFWERGKYEKVEVGVKFSDRLKSIREMQKRWFIALVNQADIDFKQLGPRSVASIQKKAARLLQLKKEWDIEQVVDDISNCPMCMKIVNPLAVLCECGFILNKVKYEANKANFVKV